jgi:hypothetical protein
LVVDPREVTVRLSQVQGIGVDNASREMLTVLAVGRCRELNDLLPDEQVGDGTPAWCSHMVSFIDV